MLQQPSLPAVPTAAPSNVTATSPTFHTAQITWNAIPPESITGTMYYGVFYKKTHSSVWIKLAKLQSSLFTYTHQNLDEDYYVYKICGETDAGYGPNSTEVALRPSSPSTYNVIHSNTLKIKYAS